VTTAALQVLPAKYAKFITSLIGLLVIYLEMYGATWHLVPAAIAISAALGVMGVPNKTSVTPPVTPAVDPVTPPVTPPAAVPVPDPVWSSAPPPAR
jgi:hypothetical protein